MTTTLIFGILLIVAGIALAILAYALIINRRGESDADHEATESEEQVFVPPPSGPEPGPPQPASPPAAAVERTSIAAASPATAVALSTAPATPPPPSRTIDVARLLRDEVTGALLIAVGPRLYRTVDELRASSDWLRLEAAARDLQLWVAAPPQPKPVEERRPEEAPPKPKPAEERRPEEAPPRTGSMLDQINAILERKLALAPELPQGVRLAPSPEGGVRVLIGLQSYPLDQVPDAKINQLIRESVSEWENQG